LKHEFGSLEILPAVRDLEGNMASSRGEWFKPNPGWNISANWIKNNNGETHENFAKLMMNTIQQPTAGSFPFIFLSNDISRHNNTVTIRMEFESELGPGEEEGNEQNLMPIHPPYRPLILKHEPFFSHNTILKDFEFSNGSKFDVIIYKDIIKIRLQEGTFIDFQGGETAEVFFQYSIL
ncbi:MAG: hypothetical protein RQ756_07740, partial [Flavobacteriaceae bacterium]|nr:hypothetical protein [Flavobacteriaceae bacterium]